jgi:hypothetical protein
MRIRRVGTGPEFPLLQDEQEIGYVDGTRVSFRGFAGHDDAARAASIAYRALSRRRGEQPQAMEESQDGILATLLPPAPEDSEAGGWGFEIALLPEEHFEVFAIARARVMWRALRGTGMDRRMHQFGGQLLTCG